MPAYNLHWALGVLTCVFTVSFMDRTILSVVQQSIKVEMRLSDTQLGLLSGYAFALLYAVLSLPAARWSERHDRRTTIAIAITLWSLMTMLCGVARTYGALFL